MAQKTTAGKVVGSVHVYGTQACGYGYYAMADGRRVGGDGEPKAARSATDVLLLGMNDVYRAFGRLARRETVEVHYDFPQGPRMAIVRLYRLPYWGDLRWQEGRVLEVSAEAIRVAAVATGHEQRPGCVNCGRGQSDR